MMSSAVIFLPLWKKASSRSLKVWVKPLFETVTDVASSSTGSPLTESKL